MEVILVIDQIIFIIIYRLYIYKSILSLKVLVFQIFFIEKIPIGIIQIILNKNKMKLFRDLSISIKQASFQINILNVILQRMKHGSILHNH